MKPFSKNALVLLTVIQAFVFFLSNKLIKFYQSYLYQTK